MYRINILPLSYFWIQGLGFILGVAILVCAQTTVKPQRDEICESLKNNTSGENLNILTIGLTKESLILVTKDWIVYNVPISFFNSTNHQLKLHNPEHMRNRYPTLWYNYNFKTMRDKLSDSIVVANKEEEFLCFVTNDLDLLIYDLNSDYVSMGWYLDGRKELVFISTPESGIFHSTKKGNKGIELDTWQLNRDNVVHEIDHYRSICWTNKSQEIIIKEPNEDCGEYEPVQWPVMKGFVGDNTFYLFDKEEIHVFSYDAWKESNSSGKPLINVKYMDFFWCLGNFKVNNGLPLMLISFAAVLLVVMLCLIIIGVLMIARVRNQMPENVNDKPGGTGSDLKLSSIFALMKR